MSNNTNTSATAPLISGVTGIKMDDVQNYWNKIIKAEELQADETARIVFQARVKKEFKDKNENLKNF